jgi:DhnA family fructose-bisphosphate aldolase class Ia
MKLARLHRLFNPKTGRCFDVAIDHGFFNEGSFLAGIEDLPAAVASLVAAAPDAIQLTLGQARHLQALPVRGKPALVLRTDVANVYGTQLPRALFSRLIEDAVLQAVRLDAACVVVNLFRIPDEPEVTDQCIQNILRLKSQSDHYGMPLMIEPLVFQANAQAGGYMVDGDPAKIIPLVRQAVELGADIIRLRAGSRSSCAAAAGRPRRKSSPAPPPSWLRAPPESSTAATSSSTAIPAGSRGRSWPWCMTAPRWTRRCGLCPKPAVEVTWFHASLLTHPDSSAERLARSPRPPPLSFTRLISRPICDEC